MSWHRLSKKKDLSPLTWSDLFYLGIATDSILNDDQLEYPKDLWNSVDDEVEEHFGQLDVENQNDICDGLKKVVPKIKDEFEYLRSLREDDFENDEEFLNTRQRFVNRITNLLKRQFCTYEMEDE